MGTSGTTGRTSTTMSMPGRPFRWRNSSRTRRFARFRRTAPPTRRVAMMPSRATSVPFGRVKSVRKRPRLRTPFRWTRWNSGRRRIRSRRVRPRCTSGGAESPNGDSLAPLGTPALEHPLPRLRAHSLSEAMGAPAPAPVRLVRALHDPTTPPWVETRIVSEGRSACQSRRREDPAGVVPTSRRACGERACQACAERACQACAERACQAQRSEDPKARPVFKAVPRAARTCRRTRGACVGIAARRPLHARWGTPEIAPRARRGEPSMRPVCDRSEIATWHSITRNSRIVWPDPMC